MNKELRIIQAILRIYMDCPNGFNKDYFKRARNIGRMVTAIRDILEEEKPGIVTENK